MASVLRRRIPWTSRGIEAASEVGEEIPLIESGAPAIAEGAELTETSFAFATIEEAAAGLDATGVGAPIGLTIGALAALGFGAYEVYEHLIKSSEPQPYSVVAKHHADAVANPQKYIDYFDKGEPEIDIIPLENQNEEADIVPLEDQHRGWNFPGTNYVGPGNSFPNGPPLGTVDKYAYHHDKAYSEAKTQDDIRYADENFKAGVANTFWDSLSGKESLFEGVAAGVSYTGIAAKNAAESVAGKVLYPSNLPGKQWHHHDIAIMILLEVATKIKIF